MKSFEEVAVKEGSKNYEKLVSRESKLYVKAGDIRSPFARDYTRILHSSAYRRLKHKTQVFFNIDNDHICTRMEHVAHVESVSSTIATRLGLNTELTKAIAFGHDLGHAPFGHHGERVLNKFCEKYLGGSFWHEKNGLRFVDNIELLEDSYMIKRNLDLTYAVRDGIVSHCGEVDENALKPRAELIDLNAFEKGNSPATWEACVVKVSDKIAYLGRDIEDAVSLGFIRADKQKELSSFVKSKDEKAINTTVIIHNMVTDICENSSPEKGICLSSDFYELLTKIKDFNIENIYLNKRFNTFERYSELVITEIFNALLSLYDGENTICKLATRKAWHPTLISEFTEYLCKYCDGAIVPKTYISTCENKKIYGTLEDEKTYITAIIDYISGMTDRFAVKVFNEMLVY